MAEISIYIDAPALFGRMAYHWAERLSNIGHKVNTYNVEINFKPPPLKQFSNSDINLYIAGIFTLIALKQHGFPNKGKNVLWMFDPLTDDPKAKNHLYKAELFKASAAGFDVVIGMNSFITDYVRTYYPNITTEVVPYILGENELRRPLPDAERTTNILHLGRLSERRVALGNHFKSEGIRALFIWDGVYDGSHYERVSRAKVSINTFRDGLQYFNQHRIFEAWAMGSVVVTEPSKDMSQYGVEDGKHLILADLKDIPKACQAILNDQTKRKEIQAAAQSLLLENFVSDKWIKTFLNAIKTGSET